MIRDFKESDFIRCVELVNKVWDFDGHFYPKKLSDLFKKVYTGGSIAASNFLKVIEENRMVKGFLFGRVDNKNLYKNEFGGFSGSFRTIIKLFGIRGVSLKRKLRYLGYMNTHEKNRRKIESRRGCEVNLFVVDPDCQGKGIGKMLMNEFISHCKKRNKKRIVLETDKESNYGFYLNMGFKVKGGFYSPLLKEFSQTTGETYVYELTL